ncbi:hypothetical protein ABE25_18670 [Cytobacillus firmus]|nr:hypothetical protein [Cytobacillus firmus]MBG9604096.1 hypothetical protein [Cytobacillus firmus]
MPFNLNKQELEELRTQKGGNLQLESEPGATSDTKRRMPAVRVRTLSNFGHKKEDACSQSQNPVQLRTQKGGNLQLESEPGESSPLFCVNSFLGKNKLYSSYVFEVVEGAPSTTSKISLRRFYCFFSLMILFPTSSA